MNEHQNIFSKDELKFLIKHYYLDKQTIIDDLKKNFNAVKTKDQINGKIWLLRKAGKIPRIPDFDPQINQYLLDNFLQPVTELQQVLFDMMGVHYPYYDLDRQLYNIWEYKENKKTGDWSNKELKFIIDNVKKYSALQLAYILNRGLSHTRSQLSRLSLCKTDIDCKLIKKIQKYSYLYDEELAKFLKINVVTLRKLAKSINIDLQKYDGTCLPGHIKRRLAIYDIISERDHLQWCDYDSIDDLVFEKEPSLKNIDKYGENFIYSEDNMKIKKNESIS